MNCNLRRSPTNAQGKESKDSKGQWHTSKFVQVSGSVWRGYALQPLYHIFTFHLKLQQFRCHFCLFFTSVDKGWNANWECTRCGWATLDSRLAHLKEWNGWGTSCWWPNTPAVFLSPFYLIGARAWALGHVLKGNCQKPQRTSRGNQGSSRSYYCLFVLNYTANLL